MGAHSSPNHQVSPSIPADSEPHSASQHVFDDPAKSGPVNPSNGAKLTTGYAHVSMYHMFSGTRLKSLSMPLHSHFVAMAWSPDSKRLAAIAAGGQTMTASAHTAERPALVVWQWDKEKIEASSSLLAGRVTRLEISTLGNGKMCLSTSGLQHMKVWLLADSGLKMQTVLPSTQERSGHFVDHQWTELNATFSDTYNNDTSNVQSWQETTTNMAPAKQRCKDNKQKARRLLVITNSNCAALGLVDDPQPNPKTSTNGDVHEGSVLIFEATDSPPYLEHRSSIKIPILKGQLAALVVHARGFCVAGSFGLFAAYESQDDPKSPYTLLHCLNIDTLIPGRASPSWTNLAVSTSGDTLIARARDSALYAFHLGSMDVLNADGGYSEHFVPLPTGGLPHNGAILAMDIGIHRPLVATCGADNTIRVWNYVRKRCELVHLGGQVWSGDKPSCLALHPSGFQLVVGFPERVRLFSVLFQSLKLLHELPLVKCHDVKYAHGGHQFACAAGVTVIIYSAVSMVQLHSFTGHVLPIRCLVWGDGDLSLYSAGADGNVYGWDLVDRSRIEEASQLNGTSQYYAITVQAPSGGHTGTNALCPRVVASSADGMLKEVTWILGAADSIQTRELRVLDSASCGLDSGSGESHDTYVALTTMAASHNFQFLMAGTSTGAIRIYKWPVVATEDGALAEFFEFPAHDGSVAALRIANDDSMVFSAAEDGVIFVFSIDGRSDGPRTQMELNRSVVVGRNDPGILEPMLVHAGDVVQVSLEELEDSAGAVAEMSKRLENQKSENEFALHRKDLDWEAELKHVQDDREMKLASERARFENLQELYDTAVREHRTEMARRGSHHIQVTHELENQYEHKLALEMERYDRLSEEIEAIQQRCEGLLQAQAAEHEGAIRDAEGRTKRVEKELRQQIERLHEDAKHNEQMFREVSNLDKQRHKSQHFHRFLTSKNTNMKQNFSSSWPPRKRN